MKLQSKVFSLLVGVFTAFVVADQAIERWIVFPSFVGLEREEAIKDIERCRDALKREVDHLTVQCMDWAAWDDTYEFIVDGNQEYQDETLLPASFEVARLNLIYYFSTEGEVKWGEVRDLDTLALIPTDAVSFGRLAREHDLLDHKDEESVHSGVIMTDKGPLLVAALPILTSENKGPIRGTIVMGRFLNKAKIESLAEQTHVNLNIRRTDSGELSAQDRTALGSVATKSSPVTIALGQGTLAAYTVFSDISGKPVLLLRADVRRDITQKGRTAMNYATVSVIVADVVAVLVLLVLLQRFVIGPVGRLTAHAIRIGESGDLSKPLALQRNDEIGTLAAEFDQMVSHLAESRKCLADASRLAGKAEIASGVLHNVGNALNSVNVSAGRAVKKIRELEVQDLVSVTELLEQHKDNLATFMSIDERGKLIPPFLNDLSKHLCDEQAIVIDELARLTKSVSHITEIVHTQQEYAKADEVRESVSPVALLEDALHINDAALTRHGATLVRDYEEDLPAIITDRHALLQILINLINNAKYALDDGGKANKILTVRLHREFEPTDAVRIEVADNGVGIAEENLTRVFMQGYTTRSMGHGFGLHSGALAAKKIGGSLHARSDGFGLGATFTVTVPLEAQEVAE